MSRSRLREDETSTPAHPSKLVPSRDHEDTHQHESAPQVQISEKSLHPQDSQQGLIEELTHSLKGAGLHSKGAAQSPSSYGESSPQSQDLPPYTTNGENLLPPQHSTVKGQSQQLYQEQHTPCPTPGAVYSHCPHHSATINQPDSRYHPQVDDVYDHHESSYSQGARSHKLPSLRLVLISTGITTTLVIFLSIHLIACNQRIGLRLHSLLADPHRQRLIVDLNQQSPISCIKTHVSLQD